MAETTHRLTPAGLQVEECLQESYINAAFNLYWGNIRDDVAMVEGQVPGAPGPWWEWHKMIQAKIGEPELLGEDVATEEADELGLEGEDRKWFISDRIGEINEYEPSIVEVYVRNPEGEVVDVKTMPNPNLEGEEDDDG
jgi:hypothetical protein